MKIQRVMDNKLHLLMDEILEKYPEWGGTPGPDGRLQNPKLMLTGTNKMITLTVPDDADMKALDQILKNHDPSKDSVVDLKIKKMDEAKSFLKNVKVDSANLKEVVENLLMVMGIKEIEVPKKEIQKEPKNE